MARSRRRCPYCDRPIPRSRFFTCSDKCLEALRTQGYGKRPDKVPTNPGGVSRPSHTVIPCCPWPSCGGDIKDGRCIECDSPAELSDKARESNKWWVVATTCQFILIGPCGCWVPKTPDALGIHAEGLHICEDWT